MSVNIGISLVTVGLVTTCVLCSPAHSNDAISLTPMARATAEQLDVLGRQPTPHEVEWSVLVQWEKIPNGLFQLSVPEFVISLKRRQLDFVCGQRWITDGDGGWKTEVPYQLVRRPSPKDRIVPYAPYPAKLSAWVKPASDHVDVHLRFSNQSGRQLDPQVFWICLLSGYGGPEFDQLTVPGFSRDTYFSRDDRFLPWRPQEDDYVFMAAKGSALTQLGWDHHEFYQQRDGTAMAVKEHAAADGVRAAIIETPGGRCVVGLTSDSAAILGGKIMNPCTDLGLGFGPLAHGDAVDLRATAWFVEGGLSELRKKIETAD